MNHVYILLYNDSNLDRYEAKAFLSEKGARFAMKAEYYEIAHESDCDHFCGEDEASITTDEGEFYQWKIQLAEVAP